MKIERGIQHIYASQLKAIKEVLDTSYEELFKEQNNRQENKLFINNN